MRTVLSFVTLTLALFTVGASPSASRSLPATDDFLRVDTTLGSNWTGGTAATTVWTMNAVTGANSSYGGATDATAYWNADSFADDQYGQVVIAKGSNGYAGIVLRASGGSGYYVAIDPCSIYKYVSSVRSTLKTCSLSWTNGHTLKVTATGGATTTISVYDNLSLVDSYADSSSPLTSGAVGIGGYSDSGTHLTNWEGGNVGGGSPSIIPAICCGPRGGGWFLPKK